MDKLQIGNGGHPLLGDNIKFVQDAWRSGFSGLLRAFNSNTIDDSGKLYGCNIVIAGSNYTYTEGYAWLGDEIYYVPAQTTPQPLGVGGSAFVFSFQNQITLTGQYQNTTTQNVHYSRYATILHNTSGVYEINSACTFEFVLADLLITTGKLTTPSALSTAIAPLANKTIDTWHQVGAAGEPAYYAGWSDGASGAQGIRFKKNDIGTVSFVGSATAGGVATNSVFNLPVGYRPQFDIVMPIMQYIAGATRTMYLMKITSANGLVEIVDAINSTPTAADYHWNLQIPL